MAHRQKQRRGIGGAGRRATAIRSMCGVALAAASLLGAAAGVRADRGDRSTGSPPAVGAAPALGGVEHLASARPVPAASLLGLVAAAEVGGRRGGEDLPEFLLAAPEAKLPEDALTCYAKRLFGVRIPKTPGAGVEETTFAYVKWHDLGGKGYKDMDLYVDMYDEHKHFLVYKMPRADLTEWRLAFRRYNRGDWMGERIFELGETRPCTT